MLDGGRNMRDGDMIILKGQDVEALLEGEETQIIQIVKSAYEAHGRGESSLPHSQFLLFPDNPRNRIIALPAYLGSEFQVAGMKWVSSFPGNLQAGLNRASAVVVLNSPHTGRPEAILEGSIINAKRTAASAALAAQWLHQDEGTTRIGVIGCGIINFEIVRFLMAVYPNIKNLMIFDIDRQRGDWFKLKCQSAFESLEAEVVDSVEEVLSSCSLISIATTAAKPHIFDLSGCVSGATILHVSLRDFSPEVILSCDNVVDDIDHVCRAQTSIHLTEQVVGNRDFIRCALADILMGKAPKRSSTDKIAIFSPFGLGILDIAVGKFIRDRAVSQNRGTIIESFLSGSGG